MSDPVKIPDSNTQAALDGMISALQDAHMDLAARRVQYLLFESSALSRIQSLEESVSGLVAKLVRENALDPKARWTYNGADKTLIPGGP